MFSIGEFSKITRLSIKALRIYHEKDILVPTHIDEQSGYRYYDKIAVEKANVIFYLKQLQFPLHDIREILGTYEDDSEIVDFLENHHQQIESRILEYQNISHSLEAIISREKEIKMKYQNSDFDVEEKELDTQLIASVRFKGKYSDCGEAFRKIGKAMGRHLSGKPLNLYYDAEYKEIDADIEACIPVRKGVSKEGVSVRELTGGKCVALIHKGPYEDLGRSYEKILAYAKEKGYQTELPSREVYLKGPGMIFKGNPKNYLTEIQILI